MLSLNLGPLALPLPPLLLVAALAVATIVARRGLAPEIASRVETLVWTALLVGLVAARLAYLGANLDVYADHPVSALDVRDGGWFAPIGAAAGMAWAFWRARRWVPGRGAVLRASAAGFAVWLLLQAGVQLHAGDVDEARPPAVPLTALDGGRTESLADQLRGRPAVVNLWATWCGPCRAEMPVLAQAQRRHPEVLFVFANQGEPPATVHRYLAEQAQPVHNVWLDRVSALGPAVGSGGLPTTVFYDAAGRRVGAHVGALNAAALDVQIRRLLP